MTVEPPVVVPVVSMHDDSVRSLVPSRMDADRMRLAARGVQESVSRQTKVEGWLD